MLKLSNSSFFNIFLIFLGSIFLVPFFALMVKAENFDSIIEWQKSFGGSEPDSASSITITSDGGYLIAGYSESNNGDATANRGNRDYWIVKIDALGNIQWQKSLGGSGWDYAHSSQQTFDGGYIIAGESKSNDGDVIRNPRSNENCSIDNCNSDYWIVKLDSQGNIQWQKSLGGSGEDIAKSIKTTSDGGYIIAGDSDSNDGDVTGNHGKIDYWIVKLDSHGNMLWQKSLGGSLWDYANAIKITLDGGYIIAGDSSSNDGDVKGNHGGRDYWIVKIDSQGEIKWQKSFGGRGLESARDIQQTFDSGFIIVGESSSNERDLTVNKGNYDAWIVKVDSLGTLQWQKSLGGSEGDYAISCQISTDGGYMIVGYSESNDGDIKDNYGKVDYWIVKLDSQGTLQWQQSFGGSDWDEPSSIQITSDGGYIIAGGSLSNDGDVTLNFGYSDYWIVKLRNIVNTMTSQSIM
ncbi:MAG: T9SS C-terminal target domain-containing protein [Deltaproteobacteria bacterium]|jgi:hypothetical protein|nr:T9SS C-terminal target domain-containing protein [Deltaproteobacteria bacterium]